jgi:hypothetical protein
MTTPTPMNQNNSRVEETMTEEELEAEGDWDENPEQPFEIEMQ